MHNLNSNLKTQRYQVKGMQSRISVSNISAKHLIIFEQITFVHNSRTTIKVIEITLIF